jgi:hypothetical protein
MKTSSQSVPQEVDLFRLSQLRSDQLPIVVNFIGIAGSSLTATVKSSKEDDKKEKRNSPSHLLSTIVHYAEGQESYYSIVRSRLLEISIQLTNAHVTLRFGL